MLSDLLWTQAQKLYGSLSWAAQDALVSSAISIPLTLLAWRIWKFTVLPALRPTEPKELPYWIPFIGHTISFFNDSNALLAKARAHFGNTQEPFALSVANTRVYVITHARDVAEAYRNTDTLSFNEFIQAMMRVLGNTEWCVQTMYRPLPTDKPNFPNPHGKCLATLTREMHMHQLYPGAQLDILEDRFLKWFDPCLSLAQMKKLPYVLGGDEKSVVLPLLEWFSDIFTRAGENAYFGDRLAEIDPGLPQAFITFDELSWQVLYQYPAFLAGEMRTAKNRVQRALLAYIKTPYEKRTGHSWFAKALEVEMRALDICEEDIATMLVTEYWGLNTNTRKAAFWLLTYLLNDPSRIEGVRKEIAGAFSGPDDTISLAYLHDHCPILDAMWNETIRMSAYSASVRFITDDTMIGGKLLRKGNRVMIPYRQLHFDETVFGSPIDEFRPERFKKSSLTRSDNWRPFGGGSTMCPGRHAAKRAVLLCVAMLLRRFDVQLDGAQSIPDAEEGKPVLGIMSVKEGQELRVRVTPRTNRSA